MTTMKLQSIFAAACILSLLTVGKANAGEEFWDFPNIWDGPRKPVIDFTYGLGTVQQRLFQGTLADINQVELKLGYSRARPRYENIVDLDEKFVVFNYSASNLFGRSVAADNVGLTIFRLGTGSRNGYAYDFRGSYLYPYHQTTFLWTKVTTARPAGLSTHDVEILDRYEGTFRFGASTEGGIAFGFGDDISLRAGYEVAVIYPRHVFWPWLGSYAIASIGVGAISGFGREIVDASPTLGPIIFALLRSGLAYGYYLVVRDDQYWPFRSETPLATESFKVRISLTF
jgi:hypothetical protein